MDARSAREAPLRRVLRVRSGLGAGPLQGGAHAEAAAGAPDANPYDRDSTEREGGAHFAASTVDVVRLDPAHGAPAERLPHTNAEREPRAGSP